MDEKQRFSMMKEAMDGILHNAPMPGALALLVIVIARTVTGQQFSDVIGELENVGEQLSDYQGRHDNGPARN